jgi:hypothetical protein
MYMEPLLWFTLPFLAFIPLTSGQAYGVQWAIPSCNNVYVVSKQFLVVTMFMLW